VLGPENGRRKFLTRLGLEANDAIDEFLNLALEYERREAPSLQGFVAWLRTAQTNVKRDMEIARNEVRVMTVHGAKGLEAPIVVLADSTTPPAGPPHRQPRLLEMPGTPDRLVWAAAKATDTDPVAAARERTRAESENEYRRLLYVALTRAIERLVVCGYDSERKRPEGCWYDLVLDALKEVAVRDPADDGDGELWRYRKASSAAAAATARPPKTTWRSCRHGFSDNVPVSRRRSRRCRHQRPTIRPPLRTFGPRRERKRRWRAHTHPHRPPQALPGSTRRSIEGRARFAGSPRSSTMATRRHHRQGAAGAADGRFCRPVPAQAAEVPIVGASRGRAAPWRCPARSTGWWSPRRPSRSPTTSTTRRPAANR
jgi:ATP-dependent exoDNAse (exonuclease V) beta subunit